MTVAVLVVLAAMVLLLALGANSNDTDSSVSDVHCYMLEADTGCPTPLGVLR